jgi:hypothetical protein
LADDEQVVVNYCDFTCYWDWQHYKQFVDESECDGAIPAYKGFYPYSLGTTNYAYMEEQDGWVQDIQEKQPYTDNRLEEYASSGTYYFKSWFYPDMTETSKRVDNSLKRGQFYVEKKIFARIQTRSRITG